MNKILEWILYFIYACFLLAAILLSLAVLIIFSPLSLALFLIGWIIETLR